MPLVDDFQFDDHNIEEMTAHSVTVREALQVLRSDFQVFRNKSPHSVSQPYVVVGWTLGGRLLAIPIQPIDEASGLWRPATAFPGDSFVGRMKKKGP